jgi:glycosyltransferase involved in cell wall biosynthesis
MKITVLICVHSKTEMNDSLLLEALDSLNKQTYKDFDTVIIFDECWDNTIKSLESKKYDFVINGFIKEKKEGLAAAKNFGLKQITSEWICFLDADDLYTTDKLMKQVEYVEKNEVDFLSALAWNKYLNRPGVFESCFKAGQYETHGQLASRLDKENVLTHGAMMIRKSCLDELGGYVDVKGMEDWDLWKRALKRGYRFHQLQDRLYVYTIGSSVER